MPIPWSEEAKPSRVTWSKATNVRIVQSVRVGGRESAPSPIGRTGEPEIDMAGEKSMNHRVRPCDDGGLVAGRVGRVVDGVAPVVDDVGPQPCRGRVVPALAGQQGRGGRAVRGDQAAAERRVVL